jgi:hypothetical protein
MRWGLAALAALATLSAAQAAETESSDTAARYAGYYFAAPSIIVTLEARDGALVAHTAGEPDTTYAPEGGGKFFASLNNTRIAFQTNADGTVTGVLVTQGSRPSIPARPISEAEADVLPTRPSTPRWRLTLAPRTPRTCPTGGSSISCVWARAARWLGFT